ncbi:MAG: hypothetical protein JWP89_6057 [Schlesneria sp.]|nr:hypothetical protein [Schlesneria sp.]
MAKKSTASKATTGSAKKPRPAKTDLDAHEEGAPIEKFRGERKPMAEHTGDPGSLEEETLDRDAPYNQTYGR